MLGMSVYTAIYGQLSDCGLYSGYISASGMKNTPVYVVSESAPPDQFVGRVIAMIKRPDDCREAKENERKLIVAPPGQAFYQSNLKELLIKSGRLSGEFQLQCLYEKSCGAVVFHRSGGGIKVLLVRNCNGKYWSFPKGHMEAGEDEHQTALREIYEETGLKVEIYGGYRQVSDYSPFGNVKKRVVFFLAETKSDSVKLQRSEIESCVWADFEQACKMCGYENDRRILLTAKEAILQHDGAEHSSAPQSREWAKQAPQS